MVYVLFIGRVLFSAIFILSALMGHFSVETIAYAANHGVPAAALLVPLSGLMALAGGLSILLGYKARIGAWLLVGFLVPMMFMMHHFWTYADLNEAMMQRAMFMKNLSMVGGALIVTYFGSGPLSLDQREWSFKKLFSFAGPAECECDEEAKVEKKPGKKSKPRA